MASRMVRDYVDADVRAHGQKSGRVARRGVRQGAGAGGLEEARARRVGEVAVVSVDIDATTLVADLGATMNATAEVALGDLAPNDVSVELLHGPVTAGDDLAHWQVVRMDRGRASPKLRAWTCGRAASSATLPAATALQCGSSRAIPTFRRPPNWAWRPGQVVGPA